MASSSSPSRSHELCMAVMVLALLCMTTSGATNKKHKSSVHYKAINCRKHSAVLTQFGAKGDGKTLNTRAFQKAIAKLAPLAADGGAQLIVPPGKWLTSSFNLTASHFTLFLHKGAEIIGPLNEHDYPNLAPLPSYGRGRDTTTGRLSSLIFGTNLTDIVITGANGTINGQGTTWWEKYRAKKLKYTRPYLIEIMHSNNVQISDITLKDSPSWNVHTIYCKNVIVQGLTILAPTDSENTDGINPDSCSDVLIQDNYIVSGDDCIAIKSGWDQYGIKVGIPSKRIAIKRLTCISPFSAGIALGSEMSGGISDVRGDDLHFLNTESAVRIKTAVGRGNYVKDIYVKNVVMKTMKYVFWMTGAYGDHPDNGYNPKAIPTVHNIQFRDMVANNVTMPGQLHGLKGKPFTDVCISNVTINLAKKHAKVMWNCSDIAGLSSKVSPQPCKHLSKMPSNDRRVGCHFPAKRLAIENVKLKKCSV